MKKLEKRVSAKAVAILLIFFLFLVVDVPVLALEQEISGGSADLTELSIEDLMNIEIESAATLTKTTPRLVPAAVTTVTEEQIRSSGARSLFELLDIYVPNLQWLRHHWEADVMGLRGIINDRDDKYLLLVNGRLMNQRTHIGALSEQDMVLLSDIHHIDIVRGPGSAMYGPGAVSMVINIVTFDPETYQGTEVTTRMGAIEEFYTAEIKHGQVFDDNDGGVFMYAGIGRYVGADKYDAPQVYPFTFPEDSTYTWGADPPPGSIPSDGTEAGEPMTGPRMSRDGADQRDLPPIKLHAQIMKDNWDIWARYTRGGKEMVWATGALARASYGWADWIWWDRNSWSARDMSRSFYGYQQATGYIGYKQEIGKDIEVDYAFSYDMFDFDKFRDNEIVDAYREDEYYGKAIMRWQPGENHSIALGGEISHLELGLPPLGWPNQDDANCQQFNPDPMPRWSTNLYSILGEWQWNINERWTTFLGGRIDDHTYTDRMISPRAAVIHTPTEKDTFKFMWSRSVRSNFEEEMKHQAMDASSSDTSAPEILDSIELRYERMQNKSFDIAASLFWHYKLEVISWNNTLGRSVNVGEQSEYGLELEASYHTEKTRLMISHGYTKLQDFELEPGQETYITAEPYGYGKDLTNWSNHITKLTAKYKLDDKWTFDASLRIYWGFPGMKEYDKYYPYTGSDAETADLPTVEDGWKRAYRGSYYLNLGLQYQPSEDLTIGLTGYNLLGIFNKDFNKRNYVEVVGSGDFRSHAPAIGVSLTYKF